jgi:hypothetical protein
MHFFTIVLARVNKTNGHSFDDILDVAEELLARFHGGECFLDNAHRNPTSKFGRWFRKNWKSSQFIAYYLGWRWNGVVTGEYRPMGLSSDESQRELLWEERCRRNITPAPSYLSVLDVDDDAFPCAIVTPDARWIETESQAGIDGDPLLRSKWRGHVRRILADHSDCYVVGFDCKV